MKDCIELFLKVAGKYKDNVCVVENGQTISYGEFMLLVQKSASYFLEKTKQPKVVINLEQGIAAYAVILGTLLAGGYYCPLSLDSPLERKQWIINQINPDFIVTQSNLPLELDNACEIDANSLFSDTITTQSIERLSKLTPHSLAYIIFTSGSTGTPKGVMIKRGSLNKFLVWSTNEFSLTPSDNWSQFSYLSFDLSIVDIFTVLCSGATLVSINNLGSKLRLKKTIEVNKITVWHSVPGIVDILINKFNNVDLSSIRIMSFCGEPLLKYQLEFLFNKNPNLVIYNTYGPTEGTLFCTYNRLDKNNYKDLTKHSASIGIPISGWNFKLRDYDENAEAKEVVIFGDYIGEGYLNYDNGMFTEILVGEKMEHAFVTGDLIEVNDGYYYFLGRKDRQVKRNGYRIEPEEIDYWIGQFSRRKSVTFIYKDFLYSIVEDESIKEVEIKEYLSQKIEKYKIPNYIYNIKNLPRNANFKIDFTELKKYIDDKENTSESV